MFVKIVCTIGPASENYDTLKAMADAGMNVARLNFSHGDYEGHEKKLKLVRQVERDVRKPIAALLDTKGPEIRTGRMQDGAIPLEQGSQIVLTGKEECVGTPKRIHVKYPLLADEVTPGQSIFIDDGSLRLEVERVDGDDVVCKVIVGGVLKDTKGVNIPGADISLPALSEKDREDIAWGIQHGMEYLAVSFVKTRQDVLDVRKLVKSCGGAMKLLAKIETYQAVQNIEEIIDVVDGVMVARGDLGVEIPTEEVPLVQKRIIALCRSKGKVVIVATQMLDSMIRNPRPTRAEVTDVATAVYDGTDAVMLSGESANGKYPVEAAQMMASIVEYTEQFLNYKQFKTRVLEKSLYESIGNAVCAATVTTAHEIQAKAIIVPTLSGATASMIAKYRPRTSIVALSPSQQTTRQMMLFWGVSPIWARRADTTDELFDSSLEELRSRHLVETGDLCVITAGVLSRLTRRQPVTSTNIMRVIQA